MLLRKLFGKITLTPMNPDIGKPYYQAISKFKSFALLKSKTNSQKGSNWCHWWTLSQPIRTFSEIDFDFCCQSQELFKYQEIAPVVKKLVKLGISDRQIASQIGVDPKMVKKAKLYL